MTRNKRSTCHCNVTQSVLTSDCSCIILHGAYSYCTALGSGDKWCVLALVRMHYMRTCVCGDCKSRFFEIRCIHDLPRKWNEHISIRIWGFLWVRFQICYTAMKWFWCNGDYSITLFNVVHKINTYNI